jgi:hypothetical protein
LVTRETNNGERPLFGLVREEEKAEEYWYDVVSS